MSIQIASAWVRDPVCGWCTEEVDTSEVFGSMEEVMETFATERKFKVLRSWARVSCGNVTVYRMEIKTEHQLEHPEYNQAMWLAELTVVEE